MENNSHKNTWGDLHEIMVSGRHVEEVAIV